jgi:hypothetical protein
MTVLSNSGFPLPEGEQSEIIGIFLELMYLGATTGSCETESSARTPIHPPKSVDELRSQWGIS